MGLISASAKAFGVHNIYLRGNRMLKMKLSKNRGEDDMLNICKLSDLQMYLVIYVLDIFPSALISKGDTNTIILDYV